MRTPAALAAILLSLASLSLGACSRTPAEPVAALLLELEVAAEGRDAERFAERLAPGFRGSHGLDRAGALLQLKRWFAAYESVALDVYGVEVARSPARAQVACVVEFSGRAQQAFGLQGFLPPSAAYRFELELAEAGGEWRVESASWQPTAPPGG